MKGKIKRVMALLLSLIMVLTMLPTTAFAAEKHTVTVSASPTAGGTVEIISGSSIASSVAVYDGNQIHVYAYPKEGYHFVRWVENGATVLNDGTAMEGSLWADFTYDVYGDHNFVAEFASNSCTLTLSADPAAGGTVETENNTPSGTFDYDSIQNIYAAPNAGYKFVGWYEDGQPATCLVNTTYTDKDAQVYLLKDTTLVAKFEVDTVTINLSADPAAGGTVQIVDTPNPDGTYNRGAAVRADALANDGYKFVGWYENGVKVYDSYMYNFAADNRTLVAMFEEEGEGEGEETAAVISSVNLTGFAVPSVGDITYDIGDPAATAESGKGYTFKYGTWFDTTGVNQFSGTFADGGTYIALLALKAETGYEFAPTESFSATVKDTNGNPVTVKSVEVGSSARVNDTADVYVEFTVDTPKIEIDTIEISGVEAPIPGKSYEVAPNGDVPASANYTITSREWMKNGGQGFAPEETFQSGQYYWARFLIEAADGYTFPSNASNITLIVNDSCYLVGEVSVWDEDEVYVFLKNISAESVYTVDDVTIAGTKGSPIVSTDITIKKEGDPFSSGVSGIKIDNLPAGLSQSTQRVDDTTVKITVTGTPTEVSTSTILFSITVKHNENAKFNITAPDVVPLTGSVEISGTAKYNETLTAVVTGTNNTGTLKYTWTRDGVAISGANEANYKLTQSDIGKVISVVVNSTNETGDLTCTGKLVEKADGPAAPTGLIGVKPSVNGGNDGKITGVDDTMIWSQNEAFTSSKYCSGTEITDLMAGTYYVRFFETLTHKASDYVTVVVPDGAAATPLAITTQPVSVTVAEGAPATVKVVAEGEGLKYQWYYTPNASDSTFFKSSTTTATYSTVMNADRAGRQVYCVVTDKYGNSVTSNTVTLSMGTALKITTQPTNVTVANGATAKTTVKATGDGLKYQWYYTLNASDSTFYKSSTTTATYSTVMNADRAGRQVYCVVTDKYGSSVKSNTVTLSMSAASLKITTQPTNVTVANGATAKTTVVATGEGLKYQWYYTLNASGSTFYKSSTTTATYSTVMNADRDGRKVYCVVTDKYGNSVKSNTVTLSMSTASLKITSQPTDVTVANGATAKTTVVATGEGLKYQWYYTLNASGSTFYKSSTTTATYSTVMNADRDGRKVYCVVTDKYGNSVKSNTVTLSMSTASLKITTQPKNVTVANGATAKTTVKATGEGLKYQWYYTLNASDSTFYKSSTTTATYSTVMNADRDGRQVYCVVTDKYGNSVTSNTVTLSMR